VAWIIRFHRKLQSEANLVDDRTERLKLRAEIHKTTATFVAGVAVILGLIVTISQFVEAQAQFEQNSENQRLQYRQQAEGLAVQKLDTAILNLSSEDSPRRISAVLTIVALSKEFPESYSDLANEVIAAFIFAGLTGRPTNSSDNYNADFPPLDLKIAIRNLPELQKLTSPKELNFVETDLSYSNLENIQLSGFSFLNSDFQHSNLKRATLSDSDLSNSIFSGAILEGTIITNSILEGITAISVNFLSTDLSGSNFSNAILTGSRFPITIMIETSLQNANLQNASFLNVRLRGADLSGANLTGSTFYGASLTDTNLKGADLTGVKFLTQSELNEAIGDNTTILPDTLNRPGHWK
jgi:uncharacterized protein YjbI with pentapeptide repeats